MIFLVNLFDGREIVNVGFNSGAYFIPLCHFNARFDRTTKAVKYATYPMRIGWLADNDN